MLLRLMTALLVLAALPGCGGDDEQAAQAPSASLEGTPWVLSGGIDVPGWETVAPSATFADGRMAGSSGCNRYSASAAIDGSSLQLGTAAATKMACEAPGNATETAFLASFDRVAGWRIADDVLTLVDAEDGEVLRFRPASPAGRWEVTAFLQGDAVSSPIVGSTLTAVFEDSGKLSGSAGCNQYSGSFTLGQDALTIGDLSATEKACASPAGVMEQEQAFLAALPKTASYTVDGSTLTLLTAEGTIVATLVATS